MRRMRLHITYNSPAVLTFVFLCLGVQLLDVITGGDSTRLLFSVTRSPLSDPLSWIRSVGHVLGHSGWEHLSGNMMYLLILGPMLEEKYGTGPIAAVMLATALITGLVSCLFFPSVRLLGASGIVFAFILLASYTAAGSGELPLTFVLTAILYLGQQLGQGIFVHDDISQLTHIVGGLVGSAAGPIMNRTIRRTRR